MDRPRDDRDEILRLRDRLHEQESKMVGVEFVLRQLLAWQENAKNQLEGLVKADEIAEAVAKKMQSTHTFHLTIVQRVGAGLFALLLVAIPIIVQKVWS